MEFSKEAITFVKERYFLKYPKDTLEDFEHYLDLYVRVPIFKANQNIHHVVTKQADRDTFDAVVDNDFVENFKDTDGQLAEEIFDESGSFNERIHWIMRMATQFYLTKAFECMKIDLDDPNIKENSLGKGTPGRVAKLWVGDNSEDTTELGSGRWNKEPYISFFPNTNKSREIITKSVDLVASCSHHMLPFSSLDGGKVTISYIPSKNVIGISKLQRYVTWVARRFWLQEDLTQYLGEQIKRIAETEDVYVKCTGIVHGCEKFRGPSTKEGSLDTEYRSGYFKNKE